MRKNLLFLSILGLLLSMTTSSNGVTYLRLNGVSSLEIDPPAAVTLDADLTSAGNQLLFEIYLDANNNEAIDGMDPIIQFVYLNDGIPTIGEEDEKIPGDEDETVNAKIKMTDTIPGDAPTGKYICRGTDEDGSTAYATIVVGQVETPSPPYIYGTIRDSNTAEQMQGIYVSAEDTARMQMGATLTDEDGYYIIPVTPTVWWVRAFDFGGQYKPDSQLVEISGVETKEVNFALIPYTSFIEGKVDSSGVGVPNVIVMATLEEGQKLIKYDSIANLKDKTSMLRLQGVVFAITDANGNYSLGVEPGTYSIGIMLVPPGYTSEPSMYQGVEVLEGERATGYNFSLVRPNSFISGKVTYEEVGVEGVDINAMSLVPFALFSTTTDSNGDYLLRCAAATYMVGASKTGYTVTYPQFGMHMNVIVTEGQTTSGIDFVVEPTGAITTIAGYVTYQDFSPATGVYVVAWNEEEKSTDGWEFCYNTDAQGHYEFVDVIPGHWLVGVYEEGYSSNPAIESIYLNYGEVDSTVNFVLGEASVEEHITEEVPFELYLNSPNPFNQQTTISYQLPNKSNVSIKVYNVTGKLVRTVIDEEQHPGSHKVDWDAKGLSSGVFFIKFVAGHYQTTEKLIFVRQ